MTRSRQPFFAAAACGALLLRLPRSPLTAVLAIAAAGVLPGYPGTSAATDSSESRSEPRPEAPDPITLRILTFPAIVYTDTVVELRVEAEPPLPAAARVQWHAEAGVLLFDDLAQTSWKAPRAEESCVVRVAVTVGVDERQRSGGIGGSGERILHAARSVHVRPPSTEGMIWIAAGSFTRGDVQGTRDAKEITTIQNSSDEPFHQVELRGYWIDRYPVTNAAYVRYLEAALAHGMVRVTPRSVVGRFEGEWVPFDYFDSYEELVWEYLDTVNARAPEFLHLISWDADRGCFSIEDGHERAPVVDVSWFGAAAYARFHGRRLPTEAQWEKAARGADTRRFPWGDHLPTAYHVNVNHYRGDAPLPVGTFSPEGDSPYGVGDMVAGLFEWTADWFNATYYEDHRAGAPLREPTGPFWGKAHSIRSFPSAILQAGGVLDDAGPVSSRYHWGFEFFVRDIFANRTTTFRTVVPSPETGYDYGDGF